MKNKVNDLFCIMNSCLLITGDHTVPLCENMGQLFVYKTSHAKAMYN